MIPQPDIRPVARGKYRLFSPYVLLHKGITFKIPKGMEYDGASVPRFAWSLTGIRPDGLLRAGALIHDVLYRHKGIPPTGWTEPARAFDRELSDLVFYQINIRAGMRSWRAWLAWKAVRWFGAVAWLK